MYRIMRVKLILYSLCWQCRVNDAFIRENIFPAFLYQQVIDFIEKEQ